MRQASCVLRESRTFRWLLWVGLVLVLVGYFGPWVPHRAAALTVSGFELAEFAKFFPQVQGGAVSLTRAFFYLPLVTASVLVAFLAGRSAVRLARWAVPLCVVVLLFAALVPYSVVESVRQGISARTPVVFDPQYARQLVLVLVGSVVALLAPLARRLARRVWGILVVLLALAGAVLPLQQFAVLRPLIVGLYDAPFGLGWGLVACVAGFAVLLFSGTLAAAGLDRADQAS